MAFDEVKIKSILGVRISCVNLAKATDLICFWAYRNERKVIICRDSRGIVYCHDNPAFMRIHDKANLITPDGIPLVWILKLYGENSISRVCGPDLMQAVCERTQGTGIKHFFYGSSYDNVTKLAANLSRDYPKLAISGFIAPSFGDIANSDHEKHIKNINASGANIIWVGLGSPKQEYWVDTYRSLLHAPVLVTVGAAFDWGAGTVRRAPRFIQYSGMEWAFRLMLEPKRLWRRNLIDNPRFVYLILCNLVSRFERSRCKRQ